MNIHEQPTPIARRLFTPGVWILLALVAIGALSGAYRFFFGLRASTNLSQQYPWGLWIVADVSLIALAAGGFTTAAIAHIFHRHRYHTLARPALVVAMLGYTFAAVALAADLGRYYNIWHPILPSMWQGNSALFEVGMCVMCYVLVLYAEFVPVFCERFAGAARSPLLSRICAAVQGAAHRVMPVLIVLGVGISCLHQSSLGHVMVLAPSKLHPLWWTPILSILFLLSAITVGFPTVIFTCICSSWALRQKPPMAVLGGLARYVPFLVTIYLGFKIGDMLIRQSYVHLADGTVETVMFGLEVFLGLVVPLALLMFRSVRCSPRWLAMACLLVMMGVVLNRANVYWIGYHPAWAQQRYFPSLTEWGLTIGVVATLLVCWRMLVIYFPVITPAPRVRRAESRGPAADPRRPSAVRRAGAGVCTLLALGLTTAAAGAGEIADVAKGTPKAVAPGEDAAAPDCQHCHDCTTPSPQDPCLRYCSRRRQPVTQGERGPDVVILNALEARYLPVPFDHTGHAVMAEMTEGCVTCHHHTPAGRTHPACETCHPVASAAASIDKPALRGAYHQLCLNCHREWINERDCAICHLAKAGGRTEEAVTITPSKDDILSVMHRPIPEPDTDLYSQSLPITQTRVFFRHDEHTGRFGLKCVECHHERSCTRCHARGTDQRPGRTVAQHHGQCLRCHKRDMDIPGREAGRCARCHWQEGQPEPAPFDHASTGWPLADYHRNCRCRDCHTQVPYRSLDRSCATCHADWDAATFDHGVTGQLLDDTHQEIGCAECHPDSRYDVAPSCESCHDEEDEGIAFLSRRPGPLFDRPDGSATQTIGPVHRRNQP